MNSKRIHNLAYAGMGLALILLAQSLNKVIPTIPVFAGVQLSQLITGTFVNALLIIICVQAGQRNGVIVGVISAILATLLGIGPIFPIITVFIAVGNALYVLVYQYVSRLHYKVWLSSIPAAFIKTGFLWVSIPFVLKVIPEISEPQVKALSIMFSWPQLITGIFGGVFAHIVLFRIPKDRK